MTNSLDLREVSERYQSAGQNYVLVAIRDKVQDWCADQEGRAVLGLDGKPLWKDPDFNPIGNRQTEGLVLALPSALNAAGSLHGRSGYDAGATCAHIRDLDLAVGDTIWVEFHAVEAQYEVVPGVFCLPIQLLVARKRGDGDIRALVDWLLLDPYYEHPVEDVAMPDGSTVKGRLNALGMVVETGVKPRPGFGVVRYLGTPLTYQADDVAVGDIVAWDCNRKFGKRNSGHSIPARIDGQDLIAVRREYVMGKLQPVPDLLPASGDHHDVCAEPVAALEILT